jgi:hypothetical protein
VKAFLEALNHKRLRSYDADPGLLKEHFGIEETVLAGGYGYRQILELVQNGADALVEAQERQVFSPVRYVPMVGRGLRGEKNGGTASCRIVTVVDNLGRFADRHPYHYCRQYFSAMESAGAAVEVPS